MKKQYDKIMIPIVGIEPCGVCRGRMDDECKECGGAGVIYVNDEATLEELLDTLEEAPEVCQYYD